MPLLDKGRDVVRGTGLLGSKCKPLHAKHLINPAVIYDPAAQRQVQRIPAHLNIVSADKINSAPTHTCGCKGT